LVPEDYKRIAGAVVGDVWKMMLKVLIPFLLQPLKRGNEE
jgi:hypothetical protein